MTLTPVRPPLPAGRKNGRLAWIDNLPVVILRDVWDVYDYGARHGQAAATNAGYIQEAIDDAVAAGAGRVAFSPDPDAGGVTTYDVTQLTVDHPNVTFAAPARGAVQLKTNTADLLRLGVTTNPYYFHMEGLILISAEGGGHVIVCADSLSHATFDRVEVVQQNAAMSLYSHVGEDYLDNVWTRYKATMPDNASVAGWYIRSNAPGTSSWRGPGRVHGAGYYLWDIETTSPTGYVNDLIWDHVTGEQTNGGLIRLAGARNCQFAHVNLFDLDDLGPITRNLWSIEAAATGLKTQNLEWHNVKRHDGTLNAGVHDVKIVTNTATAYFLFVNCGTVSPTNFQVDLNFTPAAELMSPYVTWVNDTGALTHLSPASGVNGVLAPVITATTGAQSTAVSRTATVDGTGLAVIATNTRNVTLTTPGTNAIITLPVPYAGYEVTLYNQSLIGYELRTSSPTTISINGGTGVDAESAIPAGVTVHCRGVSATKYVCTNIAADGTVTATEVAAP